MLTLKTSFYLIFLSKLSLNILILKVYSKVFLNCLQLSLAGFRLPTLTSPPHYHLYKNALGYFFFSDTFSCGCSLYSAITLDNTLVILSTVAPDAGRYYVQAVNDKNGENKTSQPVTLSVESK